MNRFILLNDQVRKHALEAVKAAPAGFVVEIKERTRTNDASAAFHAIIGDIIRAKKEWGGKTRSSDDWKAILVSAHRCALGEAGEVVPGISGEFVQLRKSTTQMGVREMSSLIEFTSAWATTNGVRLRAARFLSDDHA